MNGYGNSLQTAQTISLCSYCGTYHTPGYCSNQYQSQLVQFAYAPSTCSANSHLFACDHAVKCKCGKTTRSEADLPVTTCGGCGKTL